MTKHTIYSIVPIVFLVSFIMVPILMVSSFFSPTPTPTPEPTPIVITESPTKSSTSQVAGVDDSPAPTPNPVPVPSETPTPSLTPNPIEELNRQLNELKDLVASITPDPKTAILENKLTACREADRLWAEIKSIPSLSSKATNPQEGLYYMEEQLALHQSYISDPYQIGNGWNEEHSEIIGKYKERFDAKWPELLEKRQQQVLDWQDAIARLTQLKKQYDSVKATCEIQ